MAAKQASNIGRRSVKDPVISVTKMIPVTGATHDGGEERGHPDNGKGCWMFSQVREPAAEQCSQNKTALSSQDEHGRKQSARRRCRVGHRPKAESDQEY